jgi:hypothetical protein
LYVVLTFFVDRLQLFAVPLRLVDRAQVSLFIDIHMAF